MEQVLQTLNDFARLFVPTASLKFVFLCEPVMWAVVRRVNNLIDFSISDARWKIFTWNRSPECLTNLGWQLIRGANFWGMQNSENYLGHVNKSRHFIDTVSVWAVNSIEQVGEWNRLAKANTESINCKIFKTSSSTSTVPTGDSWADFEVYIYVSSAFFCSKSKAKH